MKIIITESQLKSIVTEHKFGSARLPENLYKQRLKRAKELAVNYPNPRQFALKHKKLWNFLRNYKLIDDVFTNRKKYGEDFTHEKIKELASKYLTPNDFELENRTAYQYASRHNMLDDLFPNNPHDQSLFGMYIGNKDESPYYNKNIQKYFDSLIDRASSQYDDIEDVKKRNPELYRQLMDLGHDIIPNDDEDDIDY
jgi:hypothetical protein